jgi:hypothetical protein
VHEVGTLSGRFDGLDGRLDGVGARIEGLGDRFGSLDTRLETASGGTAAASDAARRWPGGIS